MPYLCAGSGSVWLERPPLKRWRTAANALVAGACFRIMFVYVLRSEKDKSFYIGSTKNVEQRLNSHNSGESLSTKSKRPWVLARVEEYDSGSLALKREKFLKSAKGRRILRNLISLK